MVVRPPTLICLTYQAAPASRSPYVAGAFEVGGAVARPGSVDVQAVMRSRAASRVPAMALVRGPHLSLTVTHCQMVKARVALSHRRRHDERRPDAIGEREPGAGSALGVADVEPQYLSVLELPDEGGRRPGHAVEDGLPRHASTP